jgi:hypothetical protein
MKLDIDNYRYGWHIDGDRYRSPDEGSIRRSDEMLDMYATGVFAVDPTDPRNLFNERALHEARIATEYREYAVSRPTTSGLLARLRAAVSGTRVISAPQTCGCPA